MVRRWAAAAAVVVVAGCSSSASSSPRRWTGGSVTIVGDSMVFEAAAEFESAAAARGWRLTIHAVPGTTFADHRDDIADLADRRGAGVIVELGTNDALHDGDFTADEARDVDRAVDDLAGTGCVLFVNAGLLEPRNQDVLLRPPWDDYAPGLRAAKALDRHLADAVRGHANEHVFDWFAAYNRTPEWTRDFVHLKDEHHRDYARLVLDAFARACGRGTSRS